MTTPPARFAVPVIDVGRFATGTDDERRAVASAVDCAARGVGFMQIVGHGVPATAVTRLTAAMDAFFGRDFADKQRFRAADVTINRGYSGPRSERLSYSVGVPSAPDLFEAFNVGTPASRFPHLALPAGPYAENVWPDDAFRHAVEAWFAFAAALARRMTSIFALALELPDDFFARRTGHSLDVLRLNAYRMPDGDARVEPGQLGMGPHTDYGIVTILWADRVTPGLQILDREGAWHDVVPVPGALLVNLGDLLARWTNDRWVSTMHRVLPPVGADGRVTPRRSAAFFHDGDFDAVVACLPGCAATPADVRYEPVTVAEHIAAKLAGSRGLTLNADAVREAARLGRC